MDNRQLRIMGITIENLKNVEKGSIEFCSFDKDSLEFDEGSITGIYGQNGSGKTAVIDALAIFKELVQGNEVPNKIGNYIKINSNNMSITYNIYIKVGKQISLVNYMIVISKDINNRVFLSKEWLRAKSYMGDTSPKKYRDLFKYDSTIEEPMFLPKERCKQVYEDIDIKTDLMLAKKYSLKYDEINSVPNFTSFLFNEDSVKAFKTLAKKTNSDNNIELYTILNAMRSFAIFNIDVVENTHYGLLNSDRGIMQFHIASKINMISNFGVISVLMDEKTTLPKSIFDTFNKVVDQISEVLQTIVPDTQLKVYKPETRLLENGHEGISFQLATVRNRETIPLEYESYGVKKFISICSSLIYCFNEENYCLVIDELDAGIYEYLLGELLTIMKKQCEGQLIFTSHNLRPLEVLNNNSLIFTTTNPQNRYIKSVGIKETQNKRLSYLRSVVLGGQRECLYDETNEYDIIHALRKVERMDK